MIFSRWQKRNEMVQEYIWIFAAIIAFVVAMSFQSRGPEQMGAIAVGVYVVLRFLLGFVLNALFANVVVGVLKFDHQELDADFRLLFEHQSILYAHKAGKNDYRYEFPGYDLTMMVQPYRLPTSSRKQQTVTKVTFHELNGRNRAFVDKLTGAIDGMVKQLNNDTGKA